MKIFMIRSTSRYDFGEFFIQSNGVFFPFQGWDDFYLPIIAHWVSEMIKYKNCNEAKFSVYFMDGPYCLHFRKKGENLTINGVHEDDFAFENSFCETLNYDEVKEMLLSLAAEIVKSLLFQGYDKDKDVCFLVDQLKKENIII